LHLKLYKQEYIILAAECIGIYQLFLLTPNKVYAILLLSHLRRDFSFSCSRNIDALLKLERSSC